MRILKNGVSGRNASGFIKFVAEDGEDMYHLYNIIAAGDVIEGSTVRNVVKETATGSVKNRMHMKVKLQVEKVEFDAEQGSLRINGRNVQENEHIKMGQYHTLELELNFTYSLEKGLWDRLHLDCLKEAADPGRKAEVLCVVVDEGLCHICLVTSNMTITKARIEKTFPKKNHDSYSKVRGKFFLDIYDQLCRHCDFGRIKVLVVGSPGYWNADLLAFMLEQSQKAHNQSCAGGAGEGSEGGLLLHRHKDRLVLCHSSSARKVAVEELLESPELQRELQDVKAVADVQLLARFHQTLAEDQLRACYSQQEVEYADSQFAVDTLLVTDKLLLSPDFAKRKVLIALLDSVKEHGGSVSVLSSLHSTGAQLDLYTGIAALLRFPLHTEHLGAEAPAETRSAAELAAEQLDRELEDVAASMAFF